MFYNETNEYEDNIIYDENSYESNYEEQDDDTIRFYEQINYYLSRNFKNSIAIDLLNDKLEKYPYDFFRFVRFKKRNNKDFIQGDKVDYRVDSNHPRDITVILDANDGYKDKHIILELRYGGNEVNIITKSLNEDTSVFHIRYYSNSDTINVLNKTVKFMNTRWEETVKFYFAQFDKDGHLINYKDSDSINDDKNYKGKRFI